MVGSSQVQRILWPREIWKSIGDKSAPCGCTFENVRRNVARKYGQGKARKDTCGPGLALLEPSFSFAAYQSLSKRRVEVASATAAILWGDVASFVETTHGW